jgi:hypothetical protein
MDIVAHGLWAAAGGVAAKRKGWNIRIGWLSFWAMFPDAFAFGPPIAVGLWMLVIGKLSAGGSHAPHVHLGAPLYPLAHSLVTFSAVFAVSWLAMRRPPLAMLGWLSHILIDIPTHSFSYYATEFLWPVSQLRVDGIPWWTPWFRIATYVSLAVVYAVMWRAGWLKRTKTPANPPHGSMPQPE